MSLDNFQPKENIPKRGNRFSWFIARKILWLIGWHVEGDFPDVPKVIVVFAPHTTNRDWFIGVIMMYTLGVRVSWLAKKELFWWPLRIILYWLGGISVDRSSHHGLVDQAVDYFNNKEKIILAITPEGTRRKPAHWKTGFFYIARGADIPVLLMSLDYRKKCVTFGPVYTPGEDADEMIESMQSRLEQRVTNYSELIK